MVTFFFFFILIKHRILVSWANYLKSKEKIYYNLIKNRPIIPPQNVLLAGERKLFQFYIKYTVAIKAYFFFGSLLDTIYILTFFSIMIFSFAIWGCLIRNLECVIQNTSTQLNKFTFCKFQKQNTLRHIWTFTHSVTTENETNNNFAAGFTMKIKNKLKCIQVQSHLFAHSVRLTLKCISLFQGHDQYF